jgi:RTX calcium-binding nonapeptide repeat (4 copies)
MRRVVTLPLLFLILLLPAAAAWGKASHAGWPRITGMLLMNGANQSRPLDGRPGHDPFGGTDPSYSCDGVHKKSACVRASAHRRKPTRVVPAGIGHNELLGGHGNDTIFAGPAGDVIWGDFRPCCQPTRQVDNLYGGPGNDHIYASHGRNNISTGGGRDLIHAHFGRGEIHCDSDRVLVYLSHRSRKGYRLFGCDKISYTPERLR